MARPMAIPKPSAPSKTGMGFSLTKTSVRSRAAPAFSLVCSHASLALSETLREAYSCVPLISPAALSGSLSNSSPLGLIILKSVRISPRLRAEKALMNSGSLYPILMWASPALPLAVKLNLGCWIFYREGWVNIDHDRSVRADHHEDAAVLPSFAPNSVNEIYAGHIAEHVDDLKAAFARWNEVLKPGGRITITVPDCRGANRLWLAGKRFPGLEVDPDEGILQITTGIKPSDLHGREREAILRKRVFDES